MSYILEALKKAQAERQLGATPTIHAPTLDVAAARGAGRSQWQPVALAVAGVAVAGLLALLWRQQSATPGNAAVPAVMAGAGVPAAQLASAPPAGTMPEHVEQGGLPAAIPQAGRPDSRLAAVPAAPREAAPAGAAESKPAKPAKSAPPAPDASKATDAVDRPALTARPEPAAKPKAASAVRLGAVPKAAPAVEDAEETAQLLRELPEPIQRIVPPVAMSGYMYSKNPADRLVLIDKVLRREGEEVAPGLVLEKLQAKAAVFSFKGYRYRVPY